MVKYQRLKGLEKDAVRKKTAERGRRWLKAALAGTGTGPPATEGTSGVHTQDAGTNVDERWTG